MPKRIYVGNLPFSTTRSELKDLFSEYGKVVSVTLEQTITDNRKQDSPIKRAYIIVDDDDMPGRIIEALNNSPFKGVKISVRLE